MLMKSVAIDGRVLQAPAYTGVSYYLDSITQEWASRSNKPPVHFYFNQSKAWTPPRYISSSFQVSQTHYSNKLLGLSWRLCNSPSISEHILEDTLWLPNINFLPSNHTKRLFLSIHDLSFLFFPEFFSKKMRLWHKLINVENLIQSATGIICDSEATKLDVVDVFAIRHEKISVIPLGIDPIYFKPVNEEKSNDLPSKYIAFIGAIEPRKNVRSVISVFDELANADPELHLVIAGPMGWLSHTYQQSFNDARHKDRIKYLGYVTTDDKRRILQNAELLLFPSFYEGFGLPVLEAFASGCPVIAGATGSLPEVVGDAGMLVNPYATGDILEATRTLLYDTVLQDAFSTAGKARAKKYTWKQTADATFDILSR